MYPTENAKTSTKFLAFSLLFTTALLTRSILSLVTISSCQSRQTEAVDAPASSYSWEWEDHPSLLPGSYGFVQMVVEESVHYSITAPEAMSEWLYNSPFGTGSVRLGPNNRGFFISMFHELHCLRLTRIALESAPKPSLINHSFHCLNYLRQSALCASDTTLEPGDFMQRDFTLDRIGATHVCRDWDAIYQDMRINWVEWYLYLQDRNISLPDLEEQERVIAFGKN